VAFGAVVFQLNITNQTRLKLDVGLELRNSLGNVITSYDWGEFNDGEQKSMFGVGGYAYLWNFGNSVANVTWSSNVPSEWQLKMYISSVQWISGTYKSIPIGESLKLEINLGELTASGGVAYSFTLSFKQEG
jgi:hypothetical protein